MARSRTKPYLSASWLSRLMAGNVRCHWQYWFQVWNQLIDQQPSTFDQIGWQIGHARLLTETRRELVSVGLRPMTEVELQCRAPGYDVRINGKADCLAIDGDTVTVYDCKTGMPRDSHQVQVMIYMYALSTYPRFAGKRIQGAVIYRQRRIAIPGLPEDFADQIAYFTGLLAVDDPPIKEPGSDCRFCKITSADCPDRQDAVDDPWGLDEPEERDD